MISHDLQMSMIFYIEISQRPGLLRLVHGRHRYPATPPRQRFLAALSGPDRGPSEACLEAIHERKLDWFVTENEGHTDRMILRGEICESGLKKLSPESQYSQLSRYLSHSAPIRDL